MEHSVCSLLVFSCFAKYFPVIAVAEIKAILKTVGENYKEKMTDIETEEPAENLCMNMHIKAEIC